MKTTLSISDGIYTLFLEPDSQIEAGVIGLVCQAINSGWHAFALSVDGQYIDGWTKLPRSATVRWSKPTEEVTSR